MKRLRSNRHLTLAAFSATACLALVAAGSAHATDPIKIGFLATASGGPTIAVSKEVRQGFDLALKKLGNKLGGVPVEVVAGDDQANPDVGKQVLDRMIKRDKVDIVTGTMASGVIYATAPLAIQQQVFYVNLNVGPRDFVADKCSPFYFNTGWHIESVNEALGKYVAQQNVKKVFALGVGVPVGREHVGAFKRGYGQPLVGEIYYKPQTADFSAELAQIRAAAPDAVYMFAFGPLSVNFLKQYAQAGLASIPVYGPSPLADEDSIPASGEASLGVTTAGHWNFDLSNDVNKAFIAEFQKEHNRLPNLYNEQGYSTVMLLDVALRATGGKVDDKKALRKALEAVKIDTPRGPMAFNVDHSPVQNVYVRKVIKSDKGELHNRTQRTMAVAQQVAGAAGCVMPQ